MAKLLLGKEVNASINEEIKAKVEKLKAQDITPTLGIIRIGEREDDIAYEKSAAKSADVLNIRTTFATFVIFTALIKKLFEIAIKNALKNK